MMASNDVNGVTSQAGDVTDEAAAAAAEEFPVDPEEEAAAKEFKETCARELKEKLDALGAGIKHNTEDRFRHLEQRFSEHKEVHKARQTDVLRLNKITRDVSRALGPDWKDVFRFIMAGCDKDVLDSHIADIEKQRVFMQAYKALMTWRDVNEQGVDVDKLIEALQIHDKSALADHVKAILYSKPDVVHLDIIRAHFYEVNCTSFRPYQTHHTTSYIYLPVFYRRGRRIATNRQTWRGDGTLG